MKKIILFLSVTVLIIILSFFFMNITKKENINNENNLNNYSNNQINSNNNSLDKEEKEPEQKRIIFSEVWSQNSPYGESYEFKVNCIGEFETLNECFLFDVEAVTVTAPDKTIYELEKDFNINNYSGEITRRWVLYGPQNASLPESGSYIFTFIKENKNVLTDVVKYMQDYISYPTNVQVEREGNNIKTSWFPPLRIPEESWYKVIIWNEYGTSQLFISQQFPSNVKEVTLSNVPLIEKGNYSLNIALFYRNGYSYSEYYKFTW